MTSNVIDIDNDAPTADADDLHPFGGFISKSPLSTQKNDPQLNLASNCIRDHFGPMVQCVADALLARINQHSRSSGASFSQITAHIRSICKREFHNERQQLVQKVSFINSDKQSVNAAYRYHLNQTIGSDVEGFVVDGDLIRAALLVLIQHSIVTVHTSLKNSLVVYKYSIDERRACLFVRYPRYIEHSKNVYGPKAGFIAEELLLNGRLTTKDVISSAARGHALKKGQSGEEIDPGNDIVREEVFAGMLQ